MNRNQLHIGNLSDSVTSESLRAHMGAKRAAVIGNGLGGSRGFGFAIFETVEGRDRALKLDGTQLAGRKIQVARTRPRPLRARRRAWALRATSTPQSRKSAEAL